MRALPLSDAFATGEDLADPRAPASAAGPRPTIALYDLNRPTGGPVATYRGHADMVSALAAAPGEAKVLASGGGDGCVRLWDCRLAPERACVASFAGGPGGGRAHVELVSGLDVSGPLLASCSMDKTMCVWDIRGAVAAAAAASAAGGAGAGARPPLARHNLDGTDVLKVALRPGSGYGPPARPAAALLTMSAAYVLDLSGAVEVAPGGAGAAAGPAAAGGGGGATVVRAQLFADVAEAVAAEQGGPYQDVRWLPGAQAIVCAGNTGRLDVMAT
jgi:hypothetical protein